MKARVLTLVITLLCLSALYHSSLYSQQFVWSERTSPVSTSLNCLDGIGFFPTMFWIGGNNGVVLKTTNYGQNFINQTGNGIPTTITLISVAVFDTSIVIAAGYRNDTAYVYRTSNGGANWSLNLSQPGGRINAVNTRMVQFSTSFQQGFMAGNPVAGRWSLWRTTNKGSSWDSTGKYLPQSASETGFKGSLYYLDSSVWIGTNNSRIYHSSNNGNSWTTQIVTGETEPSAMLFIPFMPGQQHRGTFAGSQTKQGTNNSGQIWFNEPYTLSGSGRISVIVGHQAGVLNSVYPDEWYLRNDNKVYKQVSAVWQAQYTAPAGIFNDISEAAPGTYFLAVRDNGGISYCACQVWGAVNNTGGVIPDKFLLSQNYPNPFNPATTIKFSLPVNSEVNITVYNSIGAAIQTIANEQLAKGNYELTWDASKFSSGIYYYKLNASDVNNSANRITETKKMILVK